MKPYLDIPLASLFSITCQTTVRVVALSLPMNDAYLAQELDKVVQWESIEQWKFVDSGCECFYI